MSFAAVGAEAIVSAVDGFAEGAEVLFEVAAVFGGYGDVAEGGDLLVIGVKEAEVDGVGVDEGLGASVCEVGAVADAAGDVDDVALLGLGDAAVLGAEDGMDVGENEKEGGGGTGRLAVAEEALALYPNGGEDFKIAEGKGETGDVGEGDQLHFCGAPFEKK